MTETLRFLALFGVLGLVGAPLAARAVGEAAFGKVLAWLLLAWLVWILGSLGLPNGVPLVLVCAALLVAAAVALRTGFERRLWLVSEGVFAGSFVLFVVLGSYGAPVWGTEAPMDMMLVNATLTDTDVPPHDPWMSGESLNYYYLGHHMAAVLIRLTGVEPSAGYNLALAAVMALTLSTAFTLATTTARTASARRPMLAGAAAVVLIGLLGSWKGGRATLKADPLTSLDWFGASRVIPNTINEFPFFSWVVGDLHAHFLAVPLTLLAVAFALRGPAPIRSVTTACAALTIGWLYAVNSWSWPVATGLLILVVLVQHRSWRALRWAAVVIVAGIVLVLPFILGFDPNAKGIALTKEAQREEFGDFLKHHFEIYGVLVWLLVLPMAARLWGAEHRLRIVVWGLGAGAIAVPLLVGSHIAGAGLLAGLLVATLVLAPREPLWILAAGAIGCLLGAEIGVVRDEFAGGDLERMNTVFKMGYQAWILLAIFGAVALTTWPKRDRPLLAIPRVLWTVVAIVLTGVGVAYAYGGTYASRNAFKDDPGLDGRKWLEPGDQAVIKWIREETDDGAVILEAVGDDYSAFGHARISVYTGRPTVMGWQGHELQWNRDPAVIAARAADVQTLYTSADPAQVRDLLERYDVDFAVVGGLERTTYGPPQELGSYPTAYERAGVRVIAVAE